MRCAEPCRSHFSSTWSAMSAMPSNMVRSAAGPKGGHQDAVCRAPVVLLGLGGEQSVAGEVADLPQRPAELLVEPALVAQLVDQFLRTDDQHLVARQLEAVDRPILAGQFHQAQDAVVGVEVGQVAEDRYRLRLGDGLQRGGHDDVSSLERERARSISSSAGY